MQLMYAGSYDIPDEPGTSPGTGRSFKSIYSVCVVIGLAYVQSAPHLERVLDVLALAPQCARRNVSPHSFVTFPKLV